MKAYAIYHTKALTKIVCKWLYIDFHVTKQSRIHRLLSKMGDKYDSNGDYGNYTSDFKRKSMSDKVSDVQDGENEESNPASRKAGEYVRELLSEKLSLDQSKYPNASRLVDQGMFMIIFKVLCEGNA